MIVLISSFLLLNLNFAMNFLKISYSINSFENIFVFESKRVYVCYMFTLFVRFFKTKTKIDTVDNHTQFDQLNCK